MINLIKWPATILFAASIASAMAADLNVDNTHPACNDAAGTPFCTISAALDQSQPGDTITVADSTYVEAIQINKDNLTLRGVDHPTIDGGGAFTVVSIDASGVRFKGFEVTNGGTGISLIALNGSQNEVEHNWVHDTGFGIEVGPIFNETHHVIKRNRVYNNEFGISVASNKNTIRRNRVRKNGRFGIIIGSGSNDNTLINNRAHGNHGIGFLIAGSRNRFVNNKANKNGASGFHTQEGHDNEFTGNAANENQQYGFSDITFGVGTQGTANFYTDNRCENSGISGSFFPSSLCSPQP
jgi:parallel beta-helix repeat protein